MASLLSMGAGASEGLDKYLQRVMMEEQMALATRKQGADEAYRNKALEQSGETNRINRELLQQNREATLTAGLRDDERANIATLPGGTEVSPERYARILGLKAAPPERFDIQSKPDAASMAEGVPAALAPNDPVASTIKLKKTPTELANDTRFADADERIRLSAENLALRERLGLGNLDLRAKTEGRLESYGGPVVPVQTPNGVRNAPRGDATVQSGQTSPPLPAGERTAADELKNLLGLAESTLKEGDANGWTGVGPVAGTLGNLIRNVTGADVAGGAEGQANRRNLSELEAYSSFSQGGKNLTATERQMMNNYLSNMKQNPKVARQNLFDAIESIKRRSGALMSGGGADPANPPVEKKVIRYDLDGNVIP